MNTFLQAFEGLTSVEDLREKLHKKGGVYDITGCASAHLVFGIGNDSAFKLVVCADELKAKQMYEEYRSYDKESVYFPAKDLLFYQSDIRSNALTRNRMSTIEAIISGSRATVFTTIDALMNKLPSKKSFEDGVLYISAQDTVNMDELRSKLVSLGYEYVDPCEHPGEYAVHGGIIDIYPLTSELPVRIELWGDDVDSIRSFDPGTQKSVETLESVFIFPAVELILSEEQVELGLSKIEQEANSRYETLRKEMKTEEAYNLKEYAHRIVEETKEWGLSQELETHLTYFCEDTGSFIDYLPDNAYIFINEINKVAAKGKIVETEFSDAMTRRVEAGLMLPGQLDMLWSVDEVIGRIGRHPTVLMSMLDARTDLLLVDEHFSIRASGVNAYAGNYELLVEELKRFKLRRYKALLVTSSSSKAKRLAEDLRNEGISAFYTDETDRQLMPGETMVIYGNVSAGVEYPDSGFVILCEADMFGHVRKKKKAKRNVDGQTIMAYTDLHVGDYVVHENYGLGIYRGMEQIELDKVKRDYLKIEYAKGGNLYVLASQLDLIQKYGNADEKKPKLNTLGTQGWTETKQKVRSSVGVVAKELVELYAKRQHTDGFVYGPDTVWQKEFEEAFPYEETECQIEAIEAIKKDMESHKIMDRLICGDVGFGKTEVAIRAAFKAVQEGKQVVYLAPTTILAQQQYNNFVQRMGPYPVKVELMCRFRTPKEIKKTIENLKAGTVDIVVGTHRLLSKDVGYKDLGLLIIDEEQRFGVAHKETIKQLRNNVDVISLSATPIPRTMHMSLVGIRDMSLLDEAPMERMPIQTFVFEYNDEMVREAIVREMARGGQVYYVYNKVRTIADVAATIEKLVPEANVAYAHGQMSERQLEDIMVSFINKEIDVLVSTTIIEIGLDISNANTIIIHDSDNMGLSQLYQLRGRVGRSNRTAYAFLMYKRDKMLKEVAEKRLAAIKEFTDLGSGFKIAMRDLEIRGAGNLLGAEQSGHMEAIGYELYCKMLNEAVRREKGEDTKEAFDTVIDINIEAFLPDTYVKSEEQRIDLYKRIALINSEEAKDDILDELIDRFGEPKKSVNNLLWVAMVKVKAKKAGIISIEQKYENIRITMYERATLDVSRIPELLDKHSPQLRFEAGSKNPVFVFNTTANNRIKEKEVFSYLEQIIQDIDTFST